MVSVTAAMWFLMVLNPGVFYLPPVLSVELSTTFKVVASTLLGVSLFLSIIGFLRGGKTLDGIRRDIDRHFSGTTWVASSDGKTVKGVFVGVSNLSTMRLALENGAIEEVRIDHAVPVGHSLSIPGQFWPMSKIDATAEAANRQRRAAQMRVASIIMCCLGAVAAVAAFFMAKWAGGPLVFFAVSSCMVALEAGIEAKEEFAEDCGFLEDLETLRQKASEEAPIQHEIADQSLSTEVENRLDARSRTVVHVLVVVSMFAGMFTATIMGLFPMMRAVESHSNTPLDLHGIAWSVGGMLLALAATRFSDWYDRMVLLPKSYFAGHGWIAPGGAVGSVEDSIRGGSFLKLRFPDGTVDEHAIKHLRRGNAVAV